MKVSSINSIIGEAINTPKEGVVIGSYKDIAVITDTMKKLNFVDLSDGTQHSMTLFPDHTCHKSIMDMEMKYGDAFKISGKFKWVKRNDSKYLNIEDDNVVSTPTDDEIPEPYEDPKDREEAVVNYKYITSIIDEIDDPTLSKLCNTLITKYGSEYANTAAAHGHHHAHRRGLMEHVSEMLKTARAMVHGDVYGLTVYEKDLLYTGIIFHDVGKIWETQHIKGVVTTTKQGALLGHMGAGQMILYKCAEECDIDWYTDFSVTMIAHIIISHHGSNEWGSAEVPKTIVSRVIHDIDNMSAKTNSLRAIEDNGEERVAGVYVSTKGRRETFVDVNYIKNYLTETTNNA